MAGFVETTVNDIDARMRELQAELDALQAARTALLGEDGGRTHRQARRPRRAATRARSRGPARGRAGGTRSRNGGTRADQALDLVRAQPGITIPQIAESMQIEPNYLYRVLPKLADQGKVTREGQGWRVAESGT